MRQVMATDGETSGLSLVEEAGHSALPDIVTFFEAFDVAHILLAQDRRFLAANTHGQAILRSGDWLTIGSDDITVAAPHLKGPLEAAIRRGGRSILLIPDAKTDKIAAIRVSAGMGLIHIVVRPDMVARNNSYTVDFTTAFDLTNAEKRVAVELATSKTLAEIAETLGVSLETIRTHKRRIYLKMNVTSRSGLFAILAHSIA
jgi:DNA-binding CsgD family transcriptional regulator